MDDVVGARFWAKVRKTDAGCWEWSGATSHGGYGVFRLNRKNIGAHRISYEHSYGSIPSGLYVCHRCDNPPCVNPEHLYLGTPSENAREMRSKGRYGIHGGKYTKSKHKCVERSVEERFWSKVQKSPECWIWMASTTSFGHGVFFINGRQDLAHRAAYTLCVGSIPGDLHVLHHCDNPRCVRPDHLFLGTHQDNMRDMRDKGRSGVWKSPEKLARGERSGRYTKPGRTAHGERHGTHTHPEKVARGEKQGSAKLTWNDVRLIRTLFRSRTTTVRAAAEQLSVQFRVSNTTIRNIIYNYNWKEGED